MFLTPQIIIRILALLLAGSTIGAIALPEKATASEENNKPISGEINALTSPIMSLDTRLVLRLRERRVYLYQGDEIMVSYPVAVGKKGWETPTGSHQVLQMIEKPTWEHPWNNTIVPPGPENPLGERWIGFWTDGKNSIGFHGTTAENLIGQAVSHGCVRMKNEDIIALFSRVQLGTPVIVEP